VSGGRVDVFIGSEKRCESEKERRTFGFARKAARPFVKFGLSLVRRPGPIYFVDPTKGNSCSAKRWRHSLGRWCAACHQKEDVSKKVPKLLVRPEQPGAVFVLDKTARRALDKRGANASLSRGCRGCFLSLLSLARLARYAAKPAREPTERWNFGRAARNNA